MPRGVKVPFARRAELALERAGLATLYVGPWGARAADGWCLVCAPAPVADGTTVALLRGRTLTDLYAAARTLAELRDGAAS